jgi:thymidylate synthase ThyX
MVLPQSMYTTVVVTGSLLGWHHMYTQRTEEHTQLETQYFAKLVGQICEETFPVSWKALNNPV